MSSLSPLQLNQAYFTEVKITSNWEMDVTGDLSTNVQFRGQVHRDNKRNWMVVLTVNLSSSNAKRVPYEGSITCTGIFAVSPQWPEEQIEKLVMVNGAGMLYATIREMVCTITARGPFDMLMLPTQSFLETYEQAKKKASTNLPETVQKS